MTSQEEQHNWNEVMLLARKYAFITAAHGGMAVLMTHENQKQQKIYKLTQYIHGLGPRPLDAEEVSNGAG